MKGRPWDSGHSLTSDENLRARYTVAATTIWSGASYIYSKDAVKILSQKNTEERETRDKSGP